MLSSPSDAVDHINTIVAFYATSLSHTVGRGYVPPSLPSLARWWFDVSSMALVHMNIFFFVNFGLLRVV